MTTYHIARWASVFENTRSRRVEFLRWVAIPNSHDGEKYTRMITRKDGAALFSAWILIIQVASRCEPRGSLVRADGTAFDAEALSIKTRAPVAWFASALPYLVEIGWLITQVHDQSLLPLDGHSMGTNGSSQGHPDSEGKEGRERIERKEDSSGLVPSKTVDPDRPFELRTSQFDAIWDDWMEFRKQSRFKAYTPIGLRGTYAKLVGMGHNRAIDSIRESIAQNWQGLFEPKNSGAPKQYQPLRTVVDVDAMVQKQRA